MNRFAAKRAARSATADIRAAIEAFLATARQPVLQEPGQNPFPLVPGHFEVDERAGTIIVSAWDEGRQLHRRVVSCGTSIKGRLTLFAERFGGNTVELLIYDEAAPQSAPLRKQATRHVFREYLRGMIRKQYPGWKLLDLSADADLQHSLSANFPRALVRKGSSGVAIIGAAPDSSIPGHSLSYGLIWLQYLRDREPQLQINELALFLPHTALMESAQRVRHLTNARFRLFTYSGDGISLEVDQSDCGNVIEELYPAAPRIASPLHSDLDISRPRPRFRGLELPAHGSEELPRLVKEMERLRSSNSPDPRNPLYLQRPEAWLESQIAANLEIVDAELAPVPLYGQVTSIHGVDRGIADLLSVTNDGQLVVLEVKADEDIHLPLQALDYWIRVAYHTRNGNFTANGYFPGRALQTVEPRLILAAPALSFHPATETILHFFASHIAVERVGLALEWRQKVRVLFRLCGDQRPA